jgi:hypothetical protein
MRHAELVKGSPILWYRVYFVYAPKAIADYFSNMFDQESAHTLKVLRAVTDDRRDYKPG